MTTTHALDQIYAILLVVLGLSHVLAARLWCELFDKLFQLKFAALIIGTLTLPFGLPVIVLHNRWVWEPAVIVTIVGWGWTIKGALYLLFPRTPDLIRPREFRGQHHKFIIAGLFAIMLGVAVAAQAFFGIGAQPPQ